ncbi:hypothetical protein, partial [Staphylococcus epidermidis]
MTHAFRSLSFMALRHKVH